MTTMMMVMLALASATPGPTSYVRATTSTTAGGGEHCLRWPEATELVLALEDCTSWDDECHARRAAIRRAIATWNDALHACTSLTLSDGILTSRRAGYDAAPGATNENIVVFRDATCRDGDCWTASGELLAVTYSTFVAATGVMVDGDVELNVATFELSATSSIACAPSSPGCPYDVQAIMTHELGHFLGLDDLLQPGSVMSQIYEGLDQRILDAGSIRGVCEIYPAGAPSQDCLAGTEVQGVEGPDGPSCQSVGGAPGADGWILALVIGVLGRRRAKFAARVRSTGLAAALALATAACQGRGLVDEGYPGQTLATGQGSLAATAGPVRDAVSLAIAWLPKSAAQAPLARVEALLGHAADDLSHGTGCLELALSTAGALDGLVPQAVSHTSALPFQFKFPVSTAPPADAELGGDGRAAIGLVVAYVDRDGSGTFERDPAAPDRLVGLSADHAKTQLLVFSEGAAPDAWGEQSKALAAVPAGFSVLTLAEDATLVALDDAYLELSPALVDDGRICP